LIQEKSPDGSWFVREEYHDKGLLERTSEAIPFWRPKWVKTQDDSSSWIIIGTTPKQKFYYMLCLRVDILHVY
jgi:hypothetical protein